ncbi:MAG: RecB family exonuclease [Ilumatobacteraceae bacterium]
MNSFPIPTTLSPSRIESFLSCPLAFRFVNVERLPDPPTEATTKGSLVHRALEVFFAEDGDRGVEHLERSVDRAIEEYRSHPDLLDLELDDGRLDRFLDDCRLLANAYLAMEDPTSVLAVGLEMRIEAPVGPVTLRGIIDRLERDADGGLVVTDYKTGRAPAPGREKKSLGGVQLYSMLCERSLGERPTRVQLMYLRSGQVVAASPTDQSTRFMETRVTAVHRAIAQACDTGEFRPQRSGLCNYCAYQRWCPEFGGDPARAAVEAPVVLGPRRG